MHNPSKYLLGYLESQGVILEPDILVKEQFKEMENSNSEYKVDNSNQMVQPVQTNIQMPNQQTNMNQQIIQPRPLNNQIVNNLNQPNNQIQMNPMQVNQFRQPQTNMQIPNQVYQNRQLYNGQTINYPNNQLQNNNVTPQVGN